MRISMIVISLLFTVIVGCSQTVKPIVNAENQLAISSVKDAPYHYQAGARFAIEPKFVESSTVTTEQEQALYQEVTLYIEQAFSKRGYVFVSEDQSPDFTVKFAVALSKDLTDEMINEHFGLMPGLVDSELLNKASFLIAVDDAIGMQRVWRGAAQGFAKEDTSNRKQRLKMIINKVLKQFDT